MSEKKITIQELLAEENLDLLSNVISIMDACINQSKSYHTQDIRSHIKSAKDTYNHIENRLLTIDKNILAGNSMNLERHMNNLDYEAKALIRISSDIQESIANLHKLFGRYRIEKTNILKELLLLSKEDKDVSVKVTKGNVNFICYIGEVKLDHDGYHLDLGDFEIDIEYSISDGCTIYANALNPNECDEGSYFHPHVNSSGEICLGDALDSTTYLIEHGMIGSLLEVIENLLRTYNTHSPYRAIEEWTIEHTCRSCGLNMRNDDPVLRQCYECRTAICEDCTIEVKGADGYDFCSSCAEIYQCEECNEYYSNVVQIRCCHENMCRECADSLAVRCVGCGNRIHTKCAYSCSVCGFLVCERCVESSTCNETLCFSCKTKQECKEEKEHDKETDETDTEEKEDN